MARCWRCHIRRTKCRIGRLVLLSRLGGNTSLVNYVAPVRLNHVARDKGVSLIAATLSSTHSRGTGASRIETSSAAPFGFYLSLGDVVSELGGG